MAKVLGPLLSLAASGTLGKTVTYRNTPTRAVALRRVLPMRPPSAAQQGERQKGSWAAASWRALGEYQRLAWGAYGATSELPAFAIFLREFIVQGCGQGDTPQLPK